MHLDCDYQEQEGVWVCSACGDTRLKAVRRNCTQERRQIGRQLPPQVRDLPEESRQLLFGDRIKQLTDALSIPQCGGCEKRQEWLNKAHRWVLGMWG
jgi:hypothetical protein